MTASVLSKYCSAGVSKGRRCDSSCAMTEHLATIQVRKRKVNRTLVTVFSKVTKIFQKMCLGHFTKQVPLLFLHMNMCKKYLLYVNVYFIHFAFHHEDEFLASPHPCINYYFKKNMKICQISWMPLILNISLKMNWF